MGEKSNRLSQTMEEPGNDSVKTYILKKSLRPSKKLCPSFMLLPNHHIYGRENVSQH